MCGLTQISLGLRREILHHRQRRMRVGEIGRERQCASDVTHFLGDDRLRIVANVIDVVEPDEPLPRLPVARAVWQPKPDLATAAEAWILAGAPHHRTKFAVLVEGKRCQSCESLAHA